MRKLIIFITLIFISCKNEHKLKKEISNKIITTNNIEIEQDNKTELTENITSKEIELDSIWVNQIFKDTPLTSDNGKFYSGYKSKVYRINSDSLKNKKLNTYIKKIGIDDGAISEIYEVLLSKNEDTLYDFKWIGNKGYIVECSMNTKLEYLKFELNSKYSFSCYDGFDDKNEKEFEIETIIDSNIKVINNKLQVQRDTITIRNEIK